MTYDPNPWAAPPEKPKGSPAVKVAAMVCGTLIVLAAIGTVGLVFGDNDQERDGVGVDAPEGSLSTDEYDAVVEATWESRSVTDQRLVCDQVELNGVWETVQAIDASGPYAMSMENQRAWERLLRAECL